MSHFAAGDRRVKNVDGTTVIAATLRPDGTKRKERRVKPGYVPPDEIAAYDASQQVRTRRGIKPKRTGPGTAGNWSAIHAARNEKAKTTGIVGGGAVKAKPKTKAQRKNEARKKRKEEEKKKAATTVSEPDIVVVPVVSEGEQLEKNVRKLKKKLRQIAELEALDVSTLSEAQQKKLATKGTLLQRLSIAETSLQSLTR